MVYIYTYIMYWFKSRPQHSVNKTWSDPLNHEYGDPLLNKQAVNGECGVSRVGRRKVLMGRRGERSCGYRGLLGPSPFVLRSALG